jgi:hypothetical protein
LIITIESRFIEGEIAVRFHRYNVDLRRVAITLLTLSGEALAKVTVHQPAVSLAPEEVLIKDWSENEGLLEALVKAGVIETTGRTEPVGFEDAHVCTLTTDALKEVPSVADSA